MGQKLWEHPAVDYWIQLTREGDKRGAKYPSRGSTDKQELGKFKTMQMRRERVVAPVPVRREYLEYASIDYCGKCGAPTVPGKRSIWRSLYANSGRVDIYVCADCGGVAHAEGDCTQSPRRVADHDTRPDGGDCGGQVLDFVRPKRRPNRRNQADTA